MFLTNASSWRAPLLRSSISWSWVATRRRRMICPIGLTPLGHASTHLKQWVQSKMPCGSSERSFSRSSCCASRGSPTKRYALASAAGPMKSGSTSIDRQSETQAPHWMHAIDCVTSTMFSWGTMYSRSGIGSLLMSQGVTRRIFCQWTSSMSTTRSLTTGMLPIGSTSIAPLRADFAAPVQMRVAGEAGLAVDADPAGAADRGAARAADRDGAVRRRLGLEDALEHGAVALHVDLELLPVGGVAGLGVVAAQLQRVLGHQ